MLDVDYKTDLDLCHNTVGNQAVVRGTLDPLELGESILVHEMTESKGDSVISWFKIDTRGVQ